MYFAVIDVVPEVDFKLLLTFENGEKKRFDMKPYLEIGIFRELQNIALFQSVHVSFDTIEWDNEADFDPEVLFADGEII